PYQIDFNNAGTTSVILSMPALVLASNHVYTVYLLGSGTTLSGVLTQDRWTRPAVRDFPENSMRQLRAFLVPVCLAALALAGCGLNPSGKGTGTTLRVANLIPG